MEDLRITIIALNERHRIIKMAKLLVQNLRAVNFSNGISPMAHRIWIWWRQSDICPSCPLEWSKVCSGLAGVVQRLPSWPLFVCFILTTAGQCRVLCNVTAFFAATRSNADGWRNFFEFQARGQTGSSECKKIKKCDLLDLLSINLFRQGSA